MWYNLRTFLCVSVTVEFFCNLRKIPIQDPAIETCFMSIDKIARMFSKFQSPSIGGEIENFSKSQEYEENMRKYEGITKNMKKYEENMKKYEGII